MIQTASDRHAPLFHVADRIHFQREQYDLDGQFFTIAVDHQPTKEFFIRLLGQHQIENAVTAIAALRMWQERVGSVTNEDIRKGLADAVWPCRFEILQSDPLLIVDSAHNRDSAHRLRQTIDDFLPGRPLLLIFGSSDDKDISGMMAELLPRVHKLVVSRSTHPRSADPEYLAQLAQGYGLPVEVAPLAEQALPMALSLVEENGVVLTAGSLFMAAAVRDVWKNR